MHIIFPYQGTNKIKKKIRIISADWIRPSQIFSSIFALVLCSSPSGPPTTRPSPAPWPAAVPTVRPSIMRPVALMTTETLMVWGIPVATLLGPVSVVPAWLHGSAVLMIPGVGVMVLWPASCEMMRASSTEHRLLFMRVAVMIVGLSVTPALCALPAPGVVVSGVSPRLPLDRRRLARVWIFLFPAFVPGQNYID